MSRQSANAHAYNPRPHLEIVPRTGEATAAQVDVAPRPMRGIMVAAALAVPMWGGIGLAVHTLWAFVR